MMTNLPASFDLVPGLTISVLGPVLGVIAAFLLVGVAYGLVAITLAAWRSDDGHTPAAKNVGTLRPVRHAA